MPAPSPVTPELRTFDSCALFDVFGLTEPDNFTPAGRRQCSSDLQDVPDGSMNEKHPLIHRREIIRTHRTYGNIHRSVL
jgi:hypothetical protein